MSELNNLQVTRNNITLVLGIGKYGKLSPLAGTEFPYPVIGVTAEERENYIKWFGESDFWDDAQTSVRRDFADLFADHLEKHDGVVVLEDLLQEMADFTSGRQSLAKVKEEIELLQDKQNEILNNPALQLDEAGVPITPEAVALLQEVRKIGTSIRPLKEKRAKIEAEYQRRADKRAATKAAKAAGK